MAFTQVFVVLSAVLVSVFGASVSSLKAVRLNDVTVVGRVQQVTVAGAVGLAYDHPGTRFITKVSNCDTIAIKLVKTGTTTNNYIVFVDGFMVDGSFNRTFSNSNFTVNTVEKWTGTLDPKKPHTVELFKSTEAQWNGRDVVPNYDVFIGFEVSQGATLLPPPALPTRKLTFLGDSITAGFCNLCDNGGPVDSGVGEQAYHLSWANQICNMLEAQCQTVAWSGFGMVRNCCGGQTLASDIWWRTLATVPSTNKSDPHGTPASNVYNFTQFVPDGVVINLGTNDHLPSKGEPGPFYNETYVDLVVRTHKAYSSAGGNPHFFLACGPMSTAYCSEIEYVIQTITGMGIKASMLDQRGFLDGKYGKSCCGHPGTQVDGAMARNGSATIKSILGY